MKGRFIRKIAAAFAAVLVTAATAAGQSKVTVSGYMTDAASGESLISATLLDRISGQGGVTNNYGFYTLTLPAGEVSLEYSYTGYETVVKEFRLTRDTVIHVGLTFSPEMLSGATVTASRSEIGVRGTQMSAIEIPVNQIRRVPALAGEVDVIKAIQLLPGVQSGTEGSAGLYVRGGGPDENLLLLDGVPIYNVNHMMGFFSVFNADAIKNVTLYKGSFPARFGSRLSSIVDVRMKDGNDQAWHGSASLGLLSAKVNVEGPIVKGKTTFNVSARRTYYDVLAQPLIALYMRNNRENGDQATGGYYFYDLNAKITHKFNNRSRLYASYYMGDDALYAKYKYFHNSLEKDFMRLGYNWGNIVGSVRWNYELTPKLFMNVTGAYTRYRSNLKVTEEYQNRDYNDEYAFSLIFKSGIRDILGCVDFDYTPTPDHSVKFGTHYIFHHFTPETASVKAEDNGTHEEWTIGQSTVGAHEVMAYAEDDWRINDHIKVNLGLNLTGFNVQGKFYPSLQPRLSGRYLINDKLSAKVGYAYMTQYLHLLSTSTISMDSLNLSVEGYYKNMDNLLEYKDGASFWGSSQGWEQKVCMGRGWAYGIEFLAQKNLGKLTGWLGYTWSHTYRLFNRPGQELNDGKPFPAKYDRRHDISLVLTYKFTDRFDASLTWVFSSGNAATLALQQFDPVSGITEYGIYYRSTADYISSRNNYRMPNYHRMDISLNWHKELKYGRRTINLSIYNAYNHMNPYLIYTGYNWDDTPVLKQLSLFPIIPTVSYIWKI